MPIRSNSPLDNDHGQQANHVANESSKLITEHKSMNCVCPNGGRNLVICIDGTSNQFGSNNTNVIELYSQIVKKTTGSDQQLTYYNSGIGTYANPRVKSMTYWTERFWHVVDLAIAINFDKIVKAAYRWLSDNYQENDRIYMFGFSRGAYQVRTLAAMIAKVGLIHKGNEEQIPFAYELYYDAESDTGSGSPSLEQSVRQPEYENGTSDSGFSSPKGSGKQPELPPAERFKKTFSRENVRVHFIGVWDTVSSIGIARGKELPKVHDAKHICFFRHALALDERRVKFLPEYVHGGLGPTADEVSSLQVKEVWFPGTHSDVGGGNLDNPNLDLGRPSLQWMSYEAISAGLRLNPQQVEWDWKTLGDTQESLTRWWRPFEWAPVTQLSYDDATSITNSPHAGRGRRIKPQQKIHSSVAFCMPDKDKTPYSPKATSDDPEVRLSELVGIGKLDDMEWAGKPIFELDIFDHTAAKDVIITLTPAANQSEDNWATPKYGVARLETLALSDEGCEALLKVEGAILSIIQCLKFADSEVKSRVLKVLIKLQDHHAFTVSPEDTTISLSFLVVIGSKDQIADSLRSKAALRLSRLVLNSETRRQLRNDPVGNCLADLLTKGGTVQEDSWQALRELVKYKDLNPTLFTHDMNEAVWNLPTHGTDNIRRLAKEMLPIAMHHDKIERKFNESTIETIRDWLTEEGIPDFRMIKVAMFYDALRKRVLNVAIFKAVWTHIIDANQRITRAALMILQLATQHSDIHDMVFHGSTIDSVVQSACDNGSPYTRSETLKLLGLLAKQTYCKKCKTIFDVGMVDVILERLTDRFENVRDEARITLGLVLMMNNGVRSPEGNTTIRHRLYNIAWHDGHKSDPSSHELQQNTRVQDRGSRLFALVIGINNYQRLPALKWAVYDADRINNYLRQDLGVPKTHIINLRNSEARAKDIIEAFHRLETDPGINEGDPIFIYYAGHAIPSEVLLQLKASGNNIQAIVPDVDDGPNEIFRAVPINPLLNSLSREKGNNITVVLNCSSASSGPGRLLQNQDEETGCLQRDRRSHVLLAACGVNEVAREDKKGGAFTTAFLKTLRAMGGSLTYVGLIHRLGRLLDPKGRPIKQSPQCEGCYKNRILFNESSPGANRFFIKIRAPSSAEQRWILEAGEAQGVTVGAEFDVYPDHIECQSNRRICRLRVIETEASKATLDWLDLTGLESFDRGSLIDPAYARLVRCGLGNKLKVYFKPAILEDVSLSDIKSAMPDDDIGPGSLYVKDENDAELLVDLTQDNHGNKAAAFSFRQHQLVKVDQEDDNIWRLPHVVPVTAIDISHVLRSVARWNWHLSRRSIKDGPATPSKSSSSTRSRNSLIAHVELQLEVTRLEPVDGAFDMEGMPVLKPVESNLNKGGVVEVKDTDEFFGINIVNSSPVDYYPYLFYFDANDQSIESYHLGATLSDKGNINPPFRSGSSLTVGYGANGEFPFTFKLRDGERKNLGCFKIFLTTQPTDFGSLEQDSPFLGVRRRDGISSRPLADSLSTMRDMETDVHASSDIVMTKKTLPDGFRHRYRSSSSMGVMKRLENLDLWGSDVVTFLQR